MASSVRPPNTAHWGVFCAFGAVVVIRSRRPGALLAFALFALTVASPASAQTLKRHVPKSHSVGTSSPVSVSQTTTTLPPTNTLTQARTTTPYTGTIPPTPAPVVNAGKPVTTTTVSVVGDVTTTKTKTETVTTTIACTGCTTTDSSTYTGIIETTGTQTVATQTSVPPPPRASLPVPPEKVK
jgi:hypothetical protein